MGQGWGECGLKDGDGRVSLVTPDVEQCQGL